MDAVDHKVFEFEGFTLDVMRRSLRTGDRDIKLRPKSFDVLCSLVEHAGRLVTKDEMIETVWPNVTVTDESLTQCVSDIRQALGDAEQRIIKTVPRRGYLFAAPVSRQAIADRFAALLAPTESFSDSGPHGERADVAPRLATWRPRWPLLAATALLLVAICAGALFWRQSADLPLPDRPSIAVLPFVNIGGDPQQSYFSDGLTEDITTRLAKFADLFVIAHDSAFAYRKHDDPRQVGRELGVRYLLEGSVRRDGERFRITAQLIDAVSGAQRWAESYDRELTGLFAVQDEVTQKIVVTLVAHITQSELDRGRRKPPEALAAYDYYLRGSAALAAVEEGGRRLYGERLFAARQILEQSVAADAHYAPAIAALADTYLRAWLVPTEFPSTAGEFLQQRTIDRALALAHDAVELDPYLAEAHAELAWILHWQYRRSEAIAEFRRAFELNPNMADGRFTILLTHGGKADNAIEFMKRAMRLDPFHRPIYYSFLASAYYLAGQYEVAIENNRIAARRVPGVVQVVIWYSASAAQLGHIEEASAAAAEVLRLDPDFTIAKFLQMISFAKPDDASRLADGLRKAGLPE
jgi:TolB-like protein/DNA-binding winged helix-turn-helix (wHTH) protein